jgi:hypothetical protein
MDLSPIKRKESSDSDNVLRVLKRVRISRTSAGQLRLAQDLVEFQHVLSSTWELRLDHDNPLVLHACYMGSQCRGPVFLVTVQRFYPHFPPSIALPDGQQVMLPVLGQWSSVLTIKDVLAQLGAGICHSRTEF